MLPKTTLRNVTNTQQVKSLKIKYLHLPNFAIFLDCLVIEVNTS